MDIVFCIDVTGSMTPILDAVKANALGLYDDVQTNPARRAGPGSAWSAGRQAPHPDHLSDPGGTLVRFSAFDGSTILPVPGGCIVFGR